MDTTFNVQIGEFSGPLDLLLSLIEERKMLISDVSLAHVAEEFINFVKSQDHFPAGQAAHFIVVAATLLLIKSRSLLPMMTLTDEEEEDIDDLERRLNLYKVFRDAAKNLTKPLGRLYFGGKRREVEPIFAPSPDLTQETLLHAVNDMLNRVPTKEKKPEVAVKTVISLKDMMGRLSERIERTLSITFTDFVGNPEDKREVVVGFLAMLELVKQGSLLVEQEGQYTDITMSHHGGVGAPRYD